MGFLCAERGMVINMELNIVDFGNRIREAREAKGQTQNSLAGSIEKNQGAISLYEKGEQTPDITTVYRLSQALDVSVDWLLGLSKKTTIDIDINKNIKTRIFYILADLLKRHIKDTDIKDFFISEVYKINDLKKIAVHEDMYIDISEIPKKYIAICMNEIPFRKFIHEFRESVSNSEELVAGGYENANHTNIIADKVIEKYLKRI